MPDLQISKLASDSVDLFINTARLSKMDYHTIEEYIFKIIRTCKQYFLHYYYDRAIPKSGCHIEVPASKFPLPNNAFKRIYKMSSKWNSGKDRYWEYLYQLIKPKIKV